MVSVIIRNRNEQQYIGFAIQSVIDSLPNAQIIVVDNNSIDESLDIVKLFNNRCNVQIINIKDYTPGRSLNEAVRLCKYDIILILSAHAQIVKLDLELVQYKLTNNSAVFGKQIPIYYGKRINRRYIWSHFVNHEVTNMYSKIEDRPFLHNAFCFYNKKDLIDLPFNESLPGKEDRYWAIEVIKQNKTYLYVPDIEVNHFYTTNGATWKGIG
jgi:glycosyltransferase involved in cell wall biosynthesis